MRLSSKDLNRQFGPIAWPPCCGCGVSGGRCCATGQSTLDVQRKVQLKRLSARARPRQTAARKVGDTSGIVEELTVLQMEAAEAATVKNDIRSLAKLSRFQWVHEGPGRRTAGCGCD